jgi:hypothetical protein
MSYYPVLKAPGAHGWTTLCNFPPNNWEVRCRGNQWVNVTWASEGRWLTESLGTLAQGSVRTLTDQELAGRVPADALALLSLTRTPLPARSDTLPKLDTPLTSTPAWRATLGLATESAQTSYQGELDPFPPQGTLLTFGPFLQFGAGLENHLVLLNVENSAVGRTSELEIFDAAGVDLKGRFQVRNNAANIIPLDGLGLGPEDLPLFICRDMAAIPLYFSRTSDGAFLSLEHTHPPSSLVVHGKRWEAQKLLKNRWFAKVAP